jgi:hypothetical protein
MTRMPRPVKRHLTAAVLTAILLIPAVVAAEPNRVERQPEGGFFAQAWTFLVSLWSDAGPGLDPDGAQTDAGPGLDPNGLDADAGSGLDPNGGS